MEPEIVLGSVSPNGNLEAFVEQDDRCAYFYLREVDEPPLGRIDFGIRSCWVRNLRPAPPSLSVEDLQSGLPPMMPTSSCAHPLGSAPLSPGMLRIVWFEEGDAAALLEGESALAIIPCWSGQSGFDGYARDCMAESALAWPLVPGNILLQRIRTAEDAWRAWDDGDPWTPVQEAGVSAIDTALGRHTNYYAIDGGAWPPQAMVRCAHQGAIVHVTCGVQLRPQPTVELSSEDPRPHRRIELGMAIERSLFDLAPGVLPRWLSAQAKYPWARLSWFGHHHTMPCDSVPTGPSGRSFPAVLFLRDPVGAPNLQFAPFRGDPVTLLWMVPISESERALAEREGSGRLSELLAARGFGFVHRDRPWVV